jgi:threonine 3-dehydrogenase
MAAEGIDNGFAVALEMSGAPSALEQAIDCLAMGGGIALLGIPARPMNVDWSKIILKAITLKGVYGREMFGTWRKMLGMLEGGLNLEPLITHRLGVHSFETGFAAMRSGASGKVVLDWTGQRPASEAQGAG